jgi:hypothetical protein
MVFVREIGDWKGESLFLFAILGEKKMNQVSFQSTHTNNIVMTTLLLNNGACDGSSMNALVILKRLVGLAIHLSHSVPCPLPITRHLK